MRIGLVMIVKNEARGIAETLRSALPLVDCADIVDTGSTDETQDIVRDSFDKHHHISSGRLHCANFVDFATTRNFAINLAGGRGVDWTLMLSGDEQGLCSVPGEIRYQLRQSKHAEHDVTVQFGDSLEYKSTRLVRPDRGGRYVGRTHEYVQCKDLGPALPLTIKHGGTGPTVERLQQDLAILLEDAAAGSSRALFYLGQSCEILADKCASAPVREATIQTAVEWYVRRTYAQPQNLEAWWALIRAGRLSRDAKMLESAHAILPHRAEPAYWLAQLLRSQGRYLEALAWAEKAAACTPPTRCRSFVETSVYREAGALVIALRNILAGEGVQ